MIIENKINANEGDACFKLLKLVITDTFKDIFAGRY